MASSDDGTKLVAVDSTPGQIYTSTDSGVTWTARNSNRQWRGVASSSDAMKLVGAWFGVASSSDGTKLAAAENSPGYIWTGGPPASCSSPAGSEGNIIYNKDNHVPEFCDGINWRPVTKSWTGADGGGCTGGSAGDTLYNADYCVSQFCDSSKWAAIGHPHARDCNNTCGTAWIDVCGVCGGGETDQNHSPGAAWSQQTGSASRGWKGVSSSSDGTKLVAVDYRPGKIYTSTDSGVTWTARDSNRNWYGAAAASDGTKLVAINTSRQWWSVASSSDGTKLVAVVGGAGVQIYTSTDSGVTWTARESSRWWQAVASSSDGTKLVAGVSLPGYIYTSTQCP